MELFHSVLQHADFSKQALGTSYLIPLRLSTAARNSFLSTHPFFLAASQLNHWGMDDRLRGVHSSGEGLGSVIHPLTLEYSGMVGRIGTDGAKADDCGACA